MRHDLEAGRPTLSFSEFREGFPALRSKTYLSICDKMILHDKVRAGVDQFLDHLAAASANRVDHELRVASSRELFARLMNVAPETVAAVRNVSDGVNTIANAIDWSEGDKVVLAADAEHPNNIYPWLRLRQRGINLHDVRPLADGAIDVDATIDAIDGRTRVVTVASATFAPGHRTDLRRLGEACRSRDVLFLVDGVQTAGIMYHDLTEDLVDAFATSTSKGLLGLYGYGFLYVAPHWIDRLSPTYLSRSSVAQKTDDHSTMGDYEFEYQPDSRRFEVGSFNLAGAYAAEESLRLLLSMGSPSIEKRVLDLAALLHDGLTEAGFPPAVPGRGPKQSHIVTLGTLDAGGHGFSSDPLVAPLSEQLTKNGVVHTIRRGQLRFGLHAFNNEADIHKTVDIVRDCQRDVRKAAG